MRLIDDNDLALEVDTQRLSRVLLQKQVVRQCDELRLLDSLASGVVRADLALLAFQNQVLDIAHCREDTVPCVEHGSVFLRHVLTSLGT